MDECEEMIRHVASRLGHGPVIRYGGSDIRLDQPFERLSLKAAFERYAPCPLEDAIRQDAFEEILSVHVEPFLGAARPAFVYDYPLTMGALARVNPEDPSVVERFELYMAGLELANAFSELVDEKEQRERFAGEEDLRREAGKPPYPLPEPFLRSLAHMPESAGIAMGLDRLAMILTGASRIDDVVALPPELL
jgi:lysyl-tRNA synthetase class 2